MKTRKLHGVVCASICPMHADSSVDYAGVKRLTRHLIDSGIHCLYPNGTNGESLSLTAEERFEVARRVAEENAGRVVFYNQCGAGRVEDSYAQARFSAALGIDGIGLMTPVFFPMDDAAMREYFDAILPELPGFAVYAYNIPARSGNDLAPGVLGGLMARHENLIGVKYSYPDVRRIQDYIACCPGREVSTLVGSDALATSCVMAGGDGWISGPSAVFARRHVALYDALMAGDYGRARALQYRICDTANRMANIPEIPAIKYMLTRMGVLENETCRPPLRALTAEEKARLDQLLDEYLDEQQ